MLGPVGLCIWLLKRRRNEAEFGGKWWKGLGAGFWFSAVTMTTVGYGDKAPRTVAGRLVALVWMFGAIIIISTFTGMIASALTANRLNGTIEGPSDLPGVKVGSIEGSASDDWLADERIGFTDFASVEEGLQAVAAGRIDAFVYDKPLLQYLINRRDDEPLPLVPGTFGRQEYGIALPQGTDLREQVNRSLLEFLQTDEWESLVRDKFGTNEQ